MGVTTLTAGVRLDVFSTGGITESGHLNTATLASPAAVGVDFSLAREILPSSDGDRLSRSGIPLPLFLCGFGRLIECNGRLRGCTLRYRGTVGINLPALLLIQHLPYVLRHGDQSHTVQWYWGHVRISVAGWLRAFGPMEYRPCWWRWL
jgi:hypothetical protein